MKPRPQLKEPVCRISIIIPVLNEQERINGLIARIRCLNASLLPEIIVVDGDPQGGTIKTINCAAVTAVACDKGRARQMNRGAAAATGNVLLFLHADTDLPAHALERIETAMSGTAHAAGAFDLGINSKRPIFRITERYVALRTRLTRVPFGDQAIFIKRSVFERLGGYQDIPVMEDVELMKRIRRSGHAVCILSDQVMTSPRRWEREGILACTLRNWVLQAAYALGVPPRHLSRWYR
jgi:rSAM/selenodomain-associated transferase 2